MKTQTVGVFEAKTRLSELIKRIERGDRFVLTKHGKAVAELRPLPPRGQKRRRGVARSKKFWMAPDFDAPLADFEDYR